MRSNVVRRALKLCGLFVDVRTEGVAPELLEELKDVFRVYSGEKLVLNCSISRGDPPADVQWYREDR